MNFNGNTLQHNNEFIIITLCYLMVPVIPMCNLIKRLIRATFLQILLQAMFINDENKHHGQAIKIARETTNNQ